MTKQLEYGVTILESVIGADWWCKLHLAGSTQDAVEQCRAWIPTDGLGTSVVVRQEADGWHLRAAWPLRARLDMPIHHGIWPLVVWWLGDSRVSQAMVDAGQFFLKCFSRPAMFAFIHAIPAGAEEFVEVDGIMLVQASWVPEDYIAVGCGGMHQLSSGKKWSKVKKEANNGQ